MSLRTGNGPRGMTEKLLGSRTEETAEMPVIQVSVDQVALTGVQTPDLPAALGRLERSAKLDLAVAYEAHCIRTEGQPLSDPAWLEPLRRLGVLRGRPGIGFPSSVHLERFGAPGRILVGDDPRLSLMGGIGVLSLITSTTETLNVIEQGFIDWQWPQIVQVLLSGRLNASVSTRDVALSLLRMGLAAQVAEVAKSGGCPVVIEFTGPGLRGLSVPERALLCSMASDVGAAAAIAGSDEKTELFLRDQRRSKAHRQLAPDAGAGCAEVVRLDLSTVEPLVQLADGTIAALGERDFAPVREIVLGGEVSGTLRDMLCAAQWFKSKRAHLDIDLVVVPATRQTLEAMVGDGTLAQLMSAGARVIPPDPRLFDGQWQRPPTNGQSLRSFTSTAHPLSPAPGWAVASVESLCQAAIAGRMQDPRLLRRATKVPCPRELPIDDTWLFDRKPSLLPPPMPRAEEPASKRPERDWIDAPAT